VLEQREKERGNRMIGSARAQFHKVHADAIYDLEIDTHHATASENIKKIQLLVKTSENRPKKTLIRLLLKADIPKIVARYSFLGLLQKNPSSLGFICIKNNKMDSNCSRFRGTS
jgi:hypothetical protein